MRKVSIITVVLFLLGSLTILCSEIQVKDEQGWYEDTGKTHKVNTQKNSIPTGSDDPTYQKLLSVERQILMSEQMIKLYEQRLDVLKQLRKQLKKKIVEQNLKPQTKRTSIEPQGTERNTLKGNDLDRAKKQENKYRRNTQSAAYVSLNEYDIDISPLRVKQSSQQNSEIKDSLVLVPPFLINKAKSYISLINFEDNQDQQTRYQYGETSNRLLFYSLQNSQQESKKHRKQDEQQNGNKFVLNLALQIKPNKIKSVKITYHQVSNTSSISNQFYVQQTITSYESNELISQEFKWHKALEFENQIIGFVNQKVYIKGKDKKMNEVDVGSKILTVYSINQYKILYIAEDKVGTINVRSLLRTDQIRFQHFLGNKTLIKQKELEKQQPQNNQQIQDDFAHQSFDAGAYWDSPFTKQFSALRAVSVHHLEDNKQVLILLSNGDLLLHLNEKFTAYTNLRTQLMKQLRFQNLFMNPSDNLLSKIQIKMELLPSFKHLVISSNLHNKLLIFNVTIPYLTQISKSSGISLFSSSSRSTELTSEYWRILQISDELHHSSKMHKQKIYDSQIYLFSTSPISKQTLPQVTKRPSDIDQKAIYLYYCHHSQQNSKGINQKEGTSEDSTPSQISNDFITVSEYRLLLNLFDQNGINVGASQSSEGRSYWWNILMVAMIIIGVLVFRKCKQSSSEPKQDWSDPLTQKLYKGKNISSSTSNLPQGRQNTKIMTKQPEKTERKPTTTKTKIEYDNMVISELQTYLEKQGQKLSKQQIAYMVRQMQQSEQQETNKKTQMKRQEKSEQNPSDLNLLKRNTPKNAEQKQKKKTNPQDKGKQDQNTKRKKQ